MSLNTLLSSMVPVVVVSRTHALLRWVGVPVRLLPDPDQIALTVLVTLLTLALSWLLIGRRQRRKQRFLLHELALARMRVEELETIMGTLSTARPATRRSGTLTYARARTQRTWSKRSCRGVPKASARFACGWTGRLTAFIMGT